MIAPPQASIKNYFAHQPLVCAFEEDSFELAYSDVRDAFFTYLQTSNLNEDGTRRPFVLAGHSQVVCTS